MTDLPPLGIGSAVQHEHDWHGLAGAEDDARSPAGDLIATYSDTWRLLAEYDDGRLDVPADAEPARGVLSAEVAGLAITEFKRQLVAKGEASPLFGGASGDRLTGILGNIEQTMFGDPLYRSREEKAAHLLCSVVKDRPFNDGNKRIASLLFLLYLAQEGVAHQITPHALTSLTLLIAESAPASKDLMVRLVVNLLTEPGDDHRVKKPPRG